MSIADEIVLFAGCLPAAPFREFVAAASVAGFDAVTIWPSMYRRAQTRESLDPPTMRHVLDDAGVRAAAIEACGDWLPDTDDDGRAGPFRSVWCRDQFFDAAHALGAPCVVAAHLGRGAVDRAAAVDSFGQLCRDAGTHGLRIALEFMPFSGVPDADSAWHMIADSGSDNAGLVLDTSHLFRSGGLTTLAGVPIGRIDVVQLADGPADPPADLVDEAMFHRVPPGEGEFDLTLLLERLEAAGLRAGIGPELYRSGWSEREASQVAADLISATRRVLP
jgi:sugar phosphate isomerase/epimerase